MAEILLLGATGKTGRRTASRLTAAGHAVRAAARHPGPAAPGVTPVRFDWADPATHDAALAGADAVYVIPPAFRLDHPPLVAALLGRARGLGVSRAVLLSARGADADPAGALALAEAALRDSGLAWTVVRPTWFMQNFSEGFLRGPIDARDAVVAPAGEGAEPFVDAEDIAAVVAAALTDARHAGQAYDLSGPEALTFGEAAGILSRHAGRPLRYEDADPAGWERGVTAAGVPPDYAALLGALFALIRDGGDAQRSDGVRRALGREPASFAEWASREAGALARAAAA